MSNWAAQRIAYAVRTPYFPEDLTSYPPWVSIYGLLEPFGQCQCGCGGETGGKRCLPCHKASKETIDQLFWNHIIADESNPNLCWEWKGKTHEHGYGVFKFRGKEQYAHRHSYKIHYGEIANDLDVLHRCDNPPCSNPLHLFSGTHLDNMKDMVMKGRNVRGERVGTAKLNTAMVAQIKADLLSGGKSQASIGQMYGVSARAIGKIANGDAWSHIIAAREVDAPHE